jgi:hypothetical protein
MGGGRWQQMQHLNHSRHAPAAAHQRLTALSFPAPFYAAGPPRPQPQQPQQPPQPALQAGIAQQLQLDAEMAPAVQPFLTLSPELLAAVASFLEGGYVLRTLPLVAAPLADNVDVLTSQVRIN